MNGLDLVAGTWWRWAAAVSLQLVPLYLALAVIDRLWGRHGSPRLLGAVWSLALLKLVLPPWLATPWSVSRLWVRGLPEQAANLSAGTNVSSGESGPWIAAQLTTAAFLIWATVMAGLCWFAWRRYRCLSALMFCDSRQAPPAIRGRLAKLARQWGVAHVPDLRVQPLARTASLVGFRRAVIFLPPVLTEPAAAEQLDHVLLHELAHVKRRDTWAHWLGLGLQAVYWFHPLVWHARRRLATLREASCDRMAANAMSQEAYRRTLLVLSRPLAAGPALSFVGRRSQLLERLDWLKGAPRSGRAETWVAVGLVTFMLLAIVPLGHRRHAPRLALDDPTGLPGASTATADELADSTRNGSRRDGSRRNGETPVSNKPVAFADLEGCLQKRFYVQAMLARAGGPQAGKPKSAESPVTKSAIVNNVLNNP